MTTTTGNVPVQRKQILTVERKMERLYALYQDEPGIQHLRYRSHFVPGYGNMRRPPCVFIGEAPGEHEDRMKVPFVGPSGRILQQLLTTIDLKREHVFTTNIVKYRPPANRDPRADEVTASWKYLADELYLTDTDILVPLGRFAWNCFYPNIRINDARGTVFTWREFKVFPMLHPATCLYDPRNRTVMFDDIKTLAELL